MKSVINVARRLQGRSLPIITLLACLFCVGSLRAQQSNLDRATLITFYQATGGDNWTINTNWLTDAPLSDWYGVGISTSSYEGRVISLNLANNNLNGHIPVEISRLRYLEHLDLSDNNLVGQIPYNFPSGRLESVRVNNNPGLFGTLSSDLSNSRSLEVLSFVGTGICEPDDPDFQEWINSLQSAGRTGCIVSITDIVGNCDPAEAEGYLDANNVRARILNNGGLFYRGEPHVYRVPRFSNSNAIFTASIWIGGLVEGQLRVAATRWGPYEFWAGPLDDSGNPPVDCDIFDRLYTVNREEIEEYERSRVAVSDLAAWPTGLGAPTLDSNGSRLDLMHLPLHERQNRLIDLDAGERPEILGDQALWWVMNDRGNTHERTGSPSLGIEVHGFAYAMSSSVDALNDATLYRYRIFNRNESAIQSTYFGIFFDPDLGDAGDDYVGTDTLRSIAYVYNGDNLDIGSQGYGEAPPAVGFKILKGPIADDDDFDNNRNGLFDEPGERMRMSHTLFYRSGGGPNEGAYTRTAHYNYMRSIWKNGQPVTYGGNGFDQNTTTQPTNYFYPGDPVTSSYWSEMKPCPGCTPNTPSDRSFLVSSGPFDLAPGQSKEIDFAIVYGRGEDHLDSITQMRRASDEVQAMFDSGFRDYPPGINLNETVRQLSPADGMVGQPLNPTLHWNPSDAAEGYLVEISTADTSYQTIVKDPFLALEDLIFNTEYSWRVRGENRYGVSSWSESWQFYTGTHSYVYDIEGLTVVQNANGPLDPPDMGTFAINNSGFPTLTCPTDPDVVCLSPTPGYQQALSDAVWGIHTGGSNRITYSTFVSRSLNARGHTIEESLGFDDFEWRFSKRCEDDPNSCLGWRRFDDEAVVQVPFELWNIRFAEDSGDDYRMVPAVLSGQGPDQMM